ncbi:DUF1801 domain-containing protein [Sphingobacterium bovistauri]|uniref:DUF1801 domain-containing protein n=1 Tax=Sphingobacterium bovistauri TaxID=2781959 RepID=A0ABS7Z7H8_9SPHI|nr:DUF1801 domain-containing protein [Sphingobacterium bovistauri]MCA5006127.1 DUF1801 domain-containing protein [Sphingobacterium bovistauri]
MKNQIVKLNIEVTAFLDSLNHPLRNEIEQLRVYILSANNELNENVKWNGPNYHLDNEDRITMKIQPPKNIQLIFHRGAKKQTQPKNRLIDDHSKLLVWKEKDRAIATFTNMSEINNSETELFEIVNEWIKEAKIVTNR